MNDKAKRRQSSKFGPWLDIIVGALSMGIDHSEFIRKHSNHPLVSGIMSKIEVDPGFHPCDHSPYARKQRIAARNRKKRPDYRYRKAA